MVKFQHYAAPFYFRKMARFHCVFLESEETFNLNPILQKAKAKLKKIQLIVAKAVNNIHYSHLNVNVILFPKAQLNTVREALWIKRYFEAQMYRTEHP